MSFTLFLTVSDLFKSSSFTSFIQQKTSKESSLDIISSHRIIKTRFLGSKAVTQHDRQHVAI